MREGGSRQSGFHIDRAHVFPPWKKKGYRPSGDEHYGVESPHPLKCEGVNQGGQIYFNEAQRNLNNFISKRWAFYIIVYKNKTREATQISTTEEG